MSETRKGLDCRIVRYLANILYFSLPESNNSLKIFKLFIHLKLFVNQR